MAISKFSGFQIADGTIKDAHLSEDAQIATTKLAEGASFLKSDGSVAAVAAISGISPTLPAHYVTKDYVDSLADTLRSVPWQNITGSPAILPDLSKSIQVPAMSGTSIIPLDTSTPTISEGTQIATVKCTPSSPDSKLAIKGSISIDCSSGNRNLIVSAFRDNVCIGAIPLNFISSGRPQVFPFSFTDPGAGASYGSSVTYTLRFGAATNCTWYINRLASQVLNGMMAKNNIIFWEYL